MRKPLRCCFGLHRWSDWYVADRFNLPTAFALFYGNVMVQRKCANCGKKQREPRYEGQRP